MAAPLLQSGTEMGLLALLHKWSYWHYHIYSDGQGDMVGAGRMSGGCCQNDASALGDGVWAEKTPSEDLWGWRKRSHSPAVWM